MERGGISHQSPAVSLKLSAINYQLFYYSDPGELTDFSPVEDLKLA